MKILIYDVDFKSSGTLYPLKDVFENIGHEVDMFDWRKYLYTYSKANISNRIKDRFLIDIVVFKINRDLREMIRKGNYDLLIVVRGEHILPETIRVAKKLIPKVVNWSTDDLFNKLNSSKRILSSFGEYDIHFSPRCHLREEYLLKGAKSFEVVDWYYRPGTVRNPPVPGNIDYSHNISFIGSYSERRKWLLNSLISFDLQLSGWGWNKRLDLKAYPNWNLGLPIRMDQMMSAFSNTKININIFTIENRDRINPRNYDIAVAGGFQISERSAEVLEVFEEDKEIVCFESPEELESKCAYYLKHDSLREKIALAGYNKIINGKNSLIDRAREISNVIISQL